MLEVPIVIICRIGWETCWKSGMDPGFFVGGGRTKKMGAIHEFGPVAPIWPPIYSLNWTYWYFGPLFCLYGPDFWPKLALFKTKIRHPGPTPGSAPGSRIGRIGWKVFTDIIGRTGWETYLI